MFKYLDNKRSKSIEKISNTLDGIILLCILGMVISLFVGFSEEEGFIYCICFLVSSISLWITNVFLKGFQKIVETAEFQQADLLKKHGNEKSDYIKKNEKKEEKIELYSWVRKLYSNEEFQIIEIIDKDTVLCVNEKNMEGIKLKKCEITKIE